MRFTISGGLFRAAYACGQRKFVSCLKQGLVVNQHLRGLNHSAAFRTIFIFAEVGYLQYRRTQILKGNLNIDAGVVDMLI
jgi:hypothetical protein